MIPQQRLEFSDPIFQQLFFRFLKENDIGNIFYQKPHYNTYKFVSSNFIYFYTPFDFIMYEIYKSKFIKKTFKQKIYFTPFKEIKDEL